MRVELADRLETHAIERSPPSRMAPRLRFTSAVGCNMAAGRVKRGTQTASPASTSYASSAQCVLFNKFSCDDVGTK